MPSTTAHQEATEMSMTAVAATTDRATTDVLTARAFFGRQQFRQLVITAVGPVVIYNLARAQKLSEVTALLIAAALPAGITAIQAARGRRLNLISGMVLAGLAVSLIFALSGGGPTWILMRDSFVTGAMAVACLVSLVVGRPVMYYMGRQFAAAAGPERLAGFLAATAHPAAMRRFRVVTAGWAVLFAAEVGVRAALVLTTSASVVLAVSPFVLGGLTAIGIALTMRYFRQGAAAGAVRPAGATSALAA